ncbi:hypothetical protein SAMN05444358_10582 [Ruegeria halocynthiae]|uniref:Translocase n=1 Tax=Ruegeria halocynthiae TaxID=985054 RepID=A0A1H3B7D3_9RHOB|nr:hypothetical protein [Ruegeria halocynthiae]SDX37872.1 hypothetical protein SAMN05444358_10582 [Ruegeria halocynthiae]
MFVIKNYVTTGGTVACALAIGYLMQSGSAQQRGAEPGAKRVASISEQETGLAGLESVVLTSSSPTEARNEILPEPSAPTPEQSHLPSNCDLSARALAVPDAQVRLRVKAPCNPDETIEIHHNGLVFSTKTDALGGLNLTVPALSEYAIFLISLPDEKGTVATTHVPEINSFNRIALQWQGETDLQLHALEFGAGYGEEGHVWSGSDTSGAGSVIHLGQGGSDAARKIEVYSFPIQSATEAGTIELSVETEVTKSNCGKALNVQSLEWRADQRLRSRDLSLDMPGCEVVGDFLVLNNLFSDLTIAAK